MNDRDLKRVGKAERALLECMVQHKTNYSRLISKTPEELAEWLADTDACPCDVSTQYCLKQDCNQCWLAWLKKEADNG